MKFVSLIAAMVLGCSCSSSAERSPPGPSDDGDSQTAPPEILANGCVASASFRGGVRCTADGQTCSRILRVLSYNVHALPEFVSGENPKDRMRRIGEILAEQRTENRHPDFVLLQEAFDKADRIVDRAGYQHAIDGPMAATSLSSGLMVLADHAVIGRDSQAFDACAAEDCLSEKGVVAVAAQIEGLPGPIVIITTHLQAQSENDATRIQQIDELVPYLERQGIEERPSIFAGDFNFKAKPDHDAHPSYEHFEGETPYISAAKRCLEEQPSCAVSLGDDGNTSEDDLWLSTNDHQYYYAPATDEVELAIVRAALTYTTEFEGAPLSDHWAKEFDYCATWRR